MYSSIKVIGASVGVYDIAQTFPQRISSVNVTKSAGNCGFGHIY